MSHDVGSQLPLASGMSCLRKKRLQAQLVRERANWRLWSPGNMKRYFQSGVGYWHIEAEQ